MITETPDIQTRIIESKEIPGWFCAQMFCVGLGMQTSTPDGLTTKYFKEIQARQTRGEE